METAAPAIYRQGRFSARWASSLFFSFLRELFFLPALFFLQEIVCLGWPRGKNTNDNQLNEAGEKYIHYAVDGAERMKQLIMDLLEYSRTGTNKDLPADTNMNEVMNEVLEVLKNPIGEKEAIIEIGPQPVLPHTSKIQMFQLMQNLVGNALKYHGAERPAIKIAAEEQADQWLFSVKDNGIGIDPKFAEKIFVIFQRLHAKNEFSGTGVGLSICKKIVEKHGGKIWFEPNPGGGSIFYFTIEKKL